MYETCKHPSIHVVADVLEGDSNNRHVQWCRRCGSYRVGFDRHFGDWRNPDSHDMTGYPPEQN